MRSRTENSLINIIAAFINKFMLLIFPFLTRSVIVKVLGSDYLGLNGLFSSVLQVLNITELGFSSALVYSMYRPIADDNTEKICALLNLYRKIYRILGILLFVIGMIIMPLIPYIIKGNTPSNINVYILYLIYLINTAISYLFFAHKKSLVEAHQRYDVTININSISSIILYSLQLMILLTLKNYYVYLIIMPAMTILENFLVARSAKKLFPELDCHGIIEKVEKKEINKHVKGLALQKICSTSRNSLDSIVISLYLGLASIAIYNNYYMIMNAVHAIQYQMTNSIRASIGNSIASKNSNDNYEIFNKINFIYMWISSWCACCLICLFQPFMKLWMGEKLMCSMGTVILLIIYFYELCLSDVITTFKEGAGLWWQGRYRTILEAILNMILTFVFGRLWGLNGVLLATIITIGFIGHGYGGYIIFKYYFINIKYLKYVLQQLIYCGVTIVTAYITYMISNLIPFVGVMQIFIIGVICILIPNILLFSIYKKTKLYENSKLFMINIIDDVKQKVINR